MAVHARKLNGLWPAPICALSLCLAAAPALGASLGPQAKTYCLRNETALGPGRSGVFEMQARLSRAGDGYVLDAWNVMPDNGQILALSAKGRIQAKGRTRFKFQDSFDNLGQGWFEADADKLTIDLERTKASPYGANIGRNYGRYTLHSAGCQWTGR